MIQKRDGRNGQDFLAVGQDEMRGSQLGHPFGLAPGWPAERSRPLSLIHADGIPFLLCTNAPLGVIPHCAFLTIGFVMFVIPFNQYGPSGYSGFSSD